jgi:hypothetical protein
MSYKPYNISKADAMYSDGRLFFTSTNSLTIASVSEVNFLWISNPSGSGIDFLLNKISFDTTLITSKKPIIRMYKNPTVTVNGTATTNFAMNDNSVITPQVIVRTGPTTSSLGTFFWALNYSQTSSPREYSFDLDLSLKPGNRILITTQGDNSYNLVVALTWGEELIS